jgi:choline dehydrogenase-like flavoprotein
MTEKYDLIIVGTGFASTFFLHEFIKKMPANSRILVLERGRIDTHAWQLSNLKNSSSPNSEAVGQTNSTKSWSFGMGFGGTSNHWWATTLRLLPNDFLIHTKYGVGKDWPVTYQELEPFYCEAEDIMQVSGPDNTHLYPRSRPYPQPPHIFNDPDKLLKQANPNLYFNVPTARTRNATQNRPSCCAIGTCSLCPVNAKFTIQNEMAELYKDPRIVLSLESTVLTVNSGANIIESVTYRRKDKTLEARAELVILGANAIFNPHILLRSGIEHPLLGKLLNEQISYDAIVDLDSVEGFQGSTSITGHGFHLYDGIHRKEKAACLIEGHNVPDALRIERGKWTQRAALRCVIEDLPDKRNFIKVNELNSDKAEVIFKGHSDYTQNTINTLPKELEKVLSGLPVEKIHPLRMNRSDGHIQGTTVMGNDPDESIVDRFLVHHKYRNLVVLGSSVFPTCSPANPTLTLSALALRTANHLT